MPRQWGREGVWVSVCTRCLCYWELINESTRRWRQGDKSCGVIKPKGHCEVTLMLLWPAKQLKIICYSVHLGETKAGTYIIVDSKLIIAVQVRRLAGTGVLDESSQQHRTVGNGSPFTASRDTAIVSLLPKCTGVFEATQKAHDVELGWYKIVILLSTTSWDAFWWTSNSSTVKKFGNKNIKTEFSSNLYHFT